MTKILYIAGYGRSGSTVLDIILGNHAEITGVGEVTWLFNDWAAPNHLCSCGMSYPECQLWKNLFLNQPPPPELAQLMRKVEKLFFIPRLLLGLVTDKDHQVYQTYQEKLFAHVISQTGSRIVVDSSKSAWCTAGRPLALTKLADQDVYVLHLVRNGLATMESLVVTGSNRAIEGYISSPKWPGLRAAFGWTIVNVWALVLGRLLGPNRYMLLRHEDFLADPAMALRAIGQFCGFDAEELIERINRDDSFQVGHLVGGNRVRLQGRIKLHRSSKRRYGDRLKPYQRLIFALVGRWLNNQLGYGGG